MRAELTRDGSIPSENTLLEEQSRAAEPGVGQSPWLWILPNFTVFISSLCIMVVELVAGRLIARHVGSSLYTWTSVIGIVLAGIAVGNYVGGRLADRYRPWEALASLFLLASGACLLVPLTNGWVGSWSLLREQDWASRIAIHVLLVFFLPAALMGTISPVAAKMALELGRQTGRTVGSVYSWGAVGSIVGTFLTGYFLIAKMGTVAVLLTVSGVLAGMAVFFGSRMILPFFWSGVIGASFLVMLGPWGWAHTAGERLGFRDYDSASVYFREESQYSRIQVEEETEMAGVRSMTLDHLIHAYIRLDDPTDLQYDYEDLYAEITMAAVASWPPERKPRALFLGGGGFVFPRWLLQRWPEGYAEVAEIDPAVTRAAFEAFGLSRNTPMKIFDLDARNHVEDLLDRRRSGTMTDTFDLVYADAFNHYSPPFHLTTLEFNEKVRQLMSSDGVFLANIIDLYRTGRFLGAVINTVEKTFPHVYALTSTIGGPSDDDERDTFVVVGSTRPLPLEGIAGKGCSCWLLQPKQLAVLRERSGGMMLTDDYAPVDNLLAPVVRAAEK